MSTRSRAFLASFAAMATVVSSSLALALPAMAVDEAPAAATAPAQDTAPKPVEVKSSKLEATPRSMNSAGQIPVSVTTTPKSGKVSVSLQTRRSGQVRTLDTAVTNSNGRASLTIPAKWADKQRTYTVAARGFATDTFTAGQALVGVVPTAVTGLKVAAVWSDKVDLTWTAKTGVSNYVVQFKPDASSNWTQFSAPTAAKETVTGLTQGTAYDFRVAAANSEGTGPFSTEVTATPARNVPGAITGLVATPSDSTVKLDWANTAFASSYEVKTTCATNTLFDSNVCPVDKRTVTVSNITWGGLINGTAYLFGVTAANAEGVGPQATIVSTPQAKASPVRNLNVVAGNGEVFLDWAPVGNATEYRTYRAGGGAAAEYGPWITATEAKVADLTNGASYTIGVQARNSFGVSAVVSDTPVIPTADVPTAPSSLSAFPGNGEVTLTWMPSERADSYQVSYRVVGSSQLIRTGLAAGFTADPYSSVISGLDNEVEYEFFVFADNEFGRSAASSVKATPTDQQGAIDPSDDTVVGVAPSAVTNLVLTPYSGRITATWSAALNAPTSYDVFFSTNQTDWTQFTTLAATTRTANITGLTNNTAYYVRVIARNADGSSAPTVSGPVTPVAIPGQVSNLRAFPSNQSVFLSWAPVAGATKYRVTYRWEGTSVWAPAIMVDAPRTSTVINALDNGDGYIINVAAVNGSGTGTASSIGPVVPNADVPSPVTNTNFTAGSGSVTLTWSASAGATGYRVTTTDLGASLLGGPISATVAATPGTVTYTVPNLVNGHRYLFTVVATNSFGYSTPAEIGPAIPGDSRPNPPTITSVTTGNNSASVAFVPGSSGGNPVTDYAYSLNAGPLVWTGLTSSPIPLTGVVNGSTYTVRLFAKNSMGTSVASNPVTFTVNPAAWAAPGSVVTTAGPNPGEITVTYTAPAAVDGLTLTGYRVSVAGSATITENVSGLSATLAAPSPSVYGNPITISVAAVGTVNSTSAAAVGASSTPVASAFYGAPSAPVITRAVATASTATVTFTAPASNGGAAITNYSYSIDGAPFVALSPADANSPVTVPVPNDANVHTVALKATNGVFTSASSNTINIVSDAPPTAPRNVSVAAGNASLNITWSAPAVAGGAGATVASYEVSTDGGVTFTSVGNVTSYPASAVNGRTYNVTVRAVNSFGITGPATPLGEVSGNPATPWGAPDAAVITGASLTPANNVRIDFTQGFDGGRNITNYEYRYSTNSGTSWTNPVSANDSSSPIEVSGLAAGTYVFQIRGFNGATAAWSNTSPAVTIVAPDVVAAPTNLVLTPADSLMDVAFDQVGSVDNYAFQTVKNGVEGAIAEFFPEESASPIFLFSDSNGDAIVNGAAYKVRLWAIKGGKYSDPSEYSNLATPFGPAPAPTNLSAAPADTVCAISFTQSGNNGAAITNYAYTIDNGANWTDLSPADAASPVTITGLTNNTTYSIRLRPYNGVEGEVSNAVSCTPAPAPTAPMLSSVDGLDKALQVNFTGGTGGGGSIANFEYTTDGGTTWAALVPADTTSPVTITRTSNSNTILVNNTIYNVALRTVNSLTPAQVSGPSNYLQGTPQDPIGPAPAPTALQATAGKLSASIAFTQTSTGGSPITNYQYSLDGANWVDANPATDVSPVVINGLQAGTTYSIRLRAVTGTVADPINGNESAPVSVTPYDNPTAPVLGAVTPGDSKLTIAITAAGNGKGRPVVNYQYSLNPAAGSPTWTALNPPASSSDTEVVIDGLTNGTPYTVALRTVTGSGDNLLTSSASSSVTGTPELPALPPVAPVIDSVTPLDKAADVAFTQGFDGNRNITSYAYSLRTKNSDGSYTAWSAPVVATSAANGNVADISSSIALRNLTNGTTYQVRLQATNAANLTSPWSDASTDFTPAGLPCAVGVTSTPGNQQLTLNVTAPAECDNGSPITGYEYSLDGGSWNSFSSSPVVISGLENGRAYTVRVRAINAVGAGPITTVGPNESTTPFGVVSAPVINEVTPGNTTLTVEFTPSSGNGRSITEYKYSLDGGAWTSTGPVTVASPMVIRNLTNGTTYSVRIQALTSNGASDPSNPVSGTPYTSPAAPTITSVAGKDASFEVSFSTGNTGGYPLNNVQYSTDNGTSWLALSPASATSPVTITRTSTDAPLVNGTTYQVRLKVVSSAPATPISNVSPQSNMVTVTPAPECVTPTAPRNIAVTASSTRSASATWDAPAGTTAQCPVTYNVSVAPAAGVSISHSPDSATSASFTGMDPSQNYTVSVTATNKAGTGPAVTSASFTTITSPSSVTGTKTQPNQASFSWPAVDGATSYVVTCLTGCVGQFTVSSTSYLPTPEYDKVFQISVAARAGSNTSTPATVSNQVVTDPAPIPATPSATWNPNAATTSAVTVTATAGADTDWLECSAPGYATQRIPTAPGGSVNCTFNVGVADRAVAVSVKAGNKFNKTKDGPTVSTATWPAAPSPTWVYNGSSSTVGDRPVTLNVTGTVGATYQVTTAGAVNALNNLRVTANWSAANSVAPSSQMAFTAWPVNRASGTIGTAVTSTVFPAAPSTPSVNTVRPDGSVNRETGPTTASLYVEWTAVPGASFYRVSDTSTGTFRNVSTAFTVLSGMPLNTRVTAFVMACGTFGCSSQGSNSATTNASWATWDVSTAGAGTGRVKVNVANMGPGAASYYILACNRTNNDACVPTSNIGTFSGTGPVNVGSFPSGNMIRIQIVGTTGPGGSGARTFSEYQSARAA